MAFVNTGFFTLIEFLASNYRGRTVRLNWNDQVTDLAEAEAARAAWVTAYNTVGAGKIKAYTHCSRAVEDALVITDDDDNEFGDAAYLICPIADRPDKNYTLELPFPKQAIFAGTVGPNRDVVDVANAGSNGLSALIDQYEFSGAAARVLISDGESLEGNIISGKRKGT